MGRNDNREMVTPEGTPDAGGQADTEPQTAELQALKQERDDLYERLLRKQAEFENYKKRIDRERSEFVQFASADLMKELLNALDSFELAIRNASRETAAKDAAKQNTLHGFELIYKQLIDTMGRFGLKPIEAKGQKFDPNFHQAVATTHSDEFEDHTVLEEMRRGYLLNGRLLRPAMVNVTTKG